MCKSKWYRIINITLALTLALGCMPANFALPQPVSATVRLPRNTPSLPPAGPRPAFAADPIVNMVAASGAPGNALDSARTHGGDRLLQFTSAGHVLGVAGDGVLVASARHMLRIDFLNSRAVAPEADGDVSGESSAGAAPPLGRVTYRNVWDGVTVVYEASGASIVKSTYYAAATKEGVQVDRIRLGYNRPVQIDEKGNLLIIYEDGTIVEGAPVAWQETEGGRKPVTATYVLHGEREVGFSLGDYVPGIPVVIDPVTTWNTFLGDSGSDISNAIAVDGSGNVYVGGNSSATWGSPVRAYTSGTDAFAAKLNSSGALQWHTFLGDSGSDFGRGIAVDSSGNVYVAGYSDITWGSPVRAFTSGTADAFAAKLSASDGSLTWNTFLGGSGGEFGRKIAVDGDLNVYVAGYSNASWGSPVRAYTSGNDDAFAAKLNSSGALQWNTFLGDSGADFGNAIAVDGSGNVYVAGYSDITWGSPVRAFTSGTADAFAAKLSASDGSLTWNTFLGGSGGEFGRKIAVDGDLNVYVAGDSSATWGSPVRAYTSGDDAFAAKLNSSGALQWHTFLGGTGTDKGRGIAVDSSGNVYVAGDSSATWQGTSSPVRAYSSGTDAFAAKLNSSGALQWNTFLGGTGTDNGYGIAVDGSGNVYVAGPSTATWGSPVRAYSSGTDAFAAGLDSSGNLTWNYFLGGSGTDSGRGIAVDSSGNVYVGGDSTATWGSPVRAYSSGTDAFAASIGNPASPTAIRLTSFTATATAEGAVLLEWRTGYEVDNLGFHLYREQSGQRVRMTPGLVAGSALFAGPGTTLTAGHSYAWLDDFALSPQSSSLRPVTYWLEEVDLNGRHTWHGPVEVKQAASSNQKAASAWARPLLLGDLGSGSDTQRSAVTGQPAGLRPQASSLAAPSTVLASRRLKQQWTLAAGPAVKLFIREEGWYRVSQPELVAAGLGPGVDPRTLQLFVEGQEVPFVVTGEQDRRFNPQNAIEFYGAGLDTPSTDTRVYWLAWGVGWGKRVQAAQSGGLGVSPPSFPFTVERKERSVYFAALKNGEAENFFGPVLASEPVEQALSLLHLDSAPPGGNGRLEVALQGMTSGSHHVRIWLNGVEVGSLDFAGQVPGRLQVPVSQSLLHEGKNLVTLLAEGGETDVSLLDVIRLTYWHTYAADGTALRFTAPAGQPVTVSGFESSQIQVVDITDPTAVQEITGKVQPQGTGFAVTITPPGPGRRTLLAFTDAQVKVPAAIEANQPSAWHQGAQGADLVIIAHQDFLGSLGPLRALREAQGWSVALIGVEDLYDEFSFGVKSPYAIRDFLARARSQWRRPPRFALLVGGASFDPRNYLGLGQFDSVPTKLVDTAFLETASDDWFADFDGNGIPNLAVGRLPVHTAQETDTVVAKIVGYEQAGAESWSGQVLLVADHNDVFDFKAASTGVGALVPAAKTVQQIFLDQVDFATARSELLTSLNQGPELVNYVGHGSVDRWRGDLLTSEDAQALTNGLRLPVVITMDCLNGLFHDPRTESLAGALLKADQGGAVAVWASSGLTEPDGQVSMNQALMPLLYHQGLTLGEAAVQAKGAVADGDVRRTWILFGDPTTRLRQ